MNLNHRDLSIHLAAVSSPQHVLNGGPKGATFPGWFLTVQNNEGYGDILYPVQLSTNKVESIALAIDQSVFPDGLGRTPITNAVKTCDRAMRDELRRQLEAAEKSAAKIPELKRLLGEG
jgi:hypothetical protein